MNTKMKRRDFLKISALAGVATLLAACQKTVTPTAAPTAVSNATAAATAVSKATAAATAVPKTTAAATAVATKSPSKYKEALMLTERVAAGLLPPVDERLSKNPIVVKPLDGIGQYSPSTPWRRVYAGVNDTMNSFSINYDGLLRWGWESNQPEANIVESWEQTEEGKVLTLHIRDGIRWSDGQPFTADDIMFWYEDTVLNEEITPPSTLSGSFIMSGAAGDLGGLSKLDDLTVQFRWTTPYPLVLPWLACKWVQPYYPKHYAQQFHPKYVDRAKLEEMAKTAGFDNWMQLFADKMGWYRCSANPERPVMDPWVSIDAMGGPRYTMRRNPYYWKVDPDGKQLPYIDEIWFDLVEDPELYNMRAATGEVTMFFWQLNPKNIALFQQEAPKHCAELYLWDNNDMLTFGFNQTVNDPEKRKVFSDVRFRRAASIAMNRQEMIDLLYSGLGCPLQAAPPPTDDLYSKEWETSYLAYDPKGAEALLDEMGLDKRDKDGYRLRFDGKTLEVTLYCALVQANLFEMITKYLKDVGIKAAVKVQEGEIDPAVPDGDGGGTLRRYMLALDPIYGIPIHYLCGWCKLWGMWYYYGAESGEEPPQYIKDLQKDWGAYSIAVGDERKKAAQKIIDFYSGNCWIIGLVGCRPQPGIVKTYFKNVPRKATWDNVLSQEGHGRPEQFWIDEAGEKECEKA